MNQINKRNQMDQTDQITRQTGLVSDGAWASPLVGLERLTEPRPKIPLW